MNNEQHLPLKKQSIFRLPTLIVIFSLLPVCGILLGSIHQSVLFLLNIINGNNEHYVLSFASILKDGFSPSQCLWPSLFLWFAFTLFIFRRTNDRICKNKSMGEDDRGVSILEKGTYGSSRWMEHDEASQIFTVCDIKNTDSVLYGQFSAGGREVVGSRNSKPGGNDHIMLIGSSGSGKSYSFIRSEILQALKRGESVVVTDPSGELYGDLAIFSKSMGFDVKVVNLSSPLNGNSWNCVAECIDPDTLSLDSSRLNEFADIYVRNAGSLGSSEGFWAGSELNLFKAAIGLCSYKRDCSIRRGLASALRQMLRMGGYSQSQIDDIIRGLTANMTVREMLNYTQMYSEQIGFSGESFQSISEQILSHATPFSMAEVYNTLLSMDSDENFRSQFFPMPLTHPAAVAYKSYDSRDLDEKIRASSRMGLLNMLQLFNDKNIKCMLSVDDLNLTEIGRKQTILFVKTPDKSEAFKPLSSLLFSFLFKDISDDWDRENSGRGSSQSPRIPVSVIMDEFYSVGAIPSFPVFIATCRKRLINITVSLQNIGQLYDLYGENGGDTILSCCDTLLFMGCNDLSTARFISSFCAGETTVRSSSYMSSARFTAPPDPYIGVSESSRKLITPDEVRRFKDGVLVVARGEQPLKLNRLPFTDHPAFRAGLLTQSSIYDIPISTATERFKDRFSDMTLGSLYCPKPTNSTPSDVTPKVTVPHLDESQLAAAANFSNLPKGEHLQFLELYPTGSDKPILIDYSDDALFSSHQNENSEVITYSENNPPKSSLNMFSRGGNIQ